VNRFEREGPVISDWRWLADSSGVAFLEQTPGNNELVVADLRIKKVEILTAAKETIRAFDVNDKRCYVYAVADPAERERRAAERKKPATVGTGHTLFELLFPDDLVTARLDSPPSYLWAVIGGKRYEVKHSGTPIVPDMSLALSPDCASLVTKIPVHDVPESWQTLYPPPYPSDPYRFQAGGSMEQWVRIDLKAGSIETLTNAPVENGLWASALGNPKWSGDGQAIVLPGTFLQAKDGTPSRPCISVVDLPSHTNACVEMLKGKTEKGVEEGYHLVQNASFIEGDRRRVAVSSYDHHDLSLKTTEYHQTVDGMWQLVGSFKGEVETGHNGLEVSVQQGFNEPPLLFAKNKGISRVIWDPNPQLKNVELGQASVYTWKDKEGRDWRGGLFKPSDYTRTHRYPLVIQTHGFMESEFRPSGLFTTALAATALSETGIVVLQISESVCTVVTPEEGSCVASGYEAAARQLISEGIVDPARIGIIGFSRTCFYVMEMLTTSSLRLKAASITDGVMEDYWQYVLWPERYPTEYDTMVGAAPFGEGLQLWLKRSPGFNLDKVNAPVLVNTGSGLPGVLLVWQPYSGLRSLNKPVDLIVLNTDEHVQTNPAVRMASQGGSVDWFRFWLQGYEDPDPAKVEQYRRWRELRKLQEKNEHSLSVSHAASH
jgi:hypothetical protein